MAQQRILVDSSFLYAAYNANDRFHRQAVEGIDPAAELVIPEVILVEVTYLLKERVGIRATLNFLVTLTNTGIRTTNLATNDFPRIRVIMATYADADFDFVDCCIMALSERLNIRQVYTFDRRDFQLFRPRHCDYLELLP